MEQEAAAASMEAATHESQQLHVRSDNDPTGSSDQEASSSKQEESQKVYIEPLHQLKMVERFLRRYAKIYDEELQLLREKVERDDDGVALDEQNDDDFKQSQDGFVDKRVRALVRHHLNLNGDT